MTTKTEERMKMVVKEYLSEQQTRMEQEILEKGSSIYLWGVMCGILIAYTGLVSITIGLMAGFMLAKKDNPIINKFALKVLTTINKSQEYVSALIPNV